MVRNGSGHDKDRIKNKHNTSTGSKMISVDVASHHASNSFLEDLFREHSITDVNFVFDNAKPRATVPRSVFLQSPKNDRSKKSISRWESIVRTESLDALENSKRNRSRTNDSRSSRNSHSLSPSSTVARREFLGSKDPLTKPSSRRWAAERSASFSAAEGSDQKKLPCLKRSKSSSATTDLPCALREDFFELVSSDENFRTSHDRIAHVVKIFGPLPPPTRQISDDNIFEGPLNTDDRKPPRRVNRPDLIQQRSSSDPSLRIPQRKAFIDSELVAPKRRARRRASIDNVPSRKELSSSKSKSLPFSKKNALRWWKLGDTANSGEDGNVTDSTQELTPSPRHNRTLTTATKILKIASKSMKTPAPRKKSRRQSTGSMPSSSSKSDRPKRPKSPPLQRPGTPPSLRRGPRSSKKSMRSESPLPEQPGTPPSLSRDHERRSRRHSDSIINIDMEVSRKLLHLSEISSPVQPVRRQSFEEQPPPPPPHLSHLPSPDKEENAVKKARKYIDRADEKELQSSSVKKVTEGKITRSKVQFSRKVCFSPKSKTVSFSPEKQHSLPIAGKDPLNEDDDDESTLIASFRRRKPFSPRYGSKRAVGGKDGDRNRDIIQASLHEHSSKGDSVVVDFEGGNSSTESFEKKCMLDLLPLAPSLDTPPQIKYTKSQRRTSMPPSSPALEKSPLQKKKKKKKRSRRRSVV